MKVRILLIVLSVIFVISCTPKPAIYTDRIQAIKMSPGNTTKTRVSAVIEEWRDSGVMVSKGEKYHVTAQGRWRTYGTCNFTGPDGIGLYTPLCFKSPLIPEIISGFSHSSLIAKIGKDGRPFAVGADFEFHSVNEGNLLFRINDTVNATVDNEGFVDVSIKLISSTDSGIENNSEHVLTNNQSIKNKEANTHQIRTALVIGNSDYQTGALRNPVNDARAIAKQLEKMGFSVMLKLNVEQQKMDDAIDMFAHKLLSGKQIALFYFAGHGIQIDGENYLIPTDAKLNRQSDVKYKAINIGQVLGSMGEAEDNLNIVILDACRDNPLPRSFRSARQGLARVEGPKGTILGFATSPGSVASDGEGENGVYTKHLLQNMKKPGLTIEQVFKEVLRGVNDETKGQQIPWTESSFTGNFSFILE